jgi:hypothetical protein
MNNIVTRWTTFRLLDPTSDITETTLAKYRRRDEAGNYIKNMSEIVPIMVVAGTGTGATMIQFNSINLFACLTTARYGQLQPSTKTTVQINIKKTDENIIKCTIWNLQCINQFKSIQPFT